MGVPRDQDFDQSRFRKLRTSFEGCDSERIIIRQSESWMEKNGFTKDELRLKLGHITISGVLYRGTVVGFLW